MGSNRVLVKKELLLRVFFTSLFTAMFHYGYLNYSFPVFGYAGNKYVEASAYSYVLTYAFAIFPSLFLSKYQKISYFGIVLIYVIIYVPGQLTIQFNISDMSLDKVTLQLFLLISFFLILFVTKVGRRQRSVQEKTLNSGLIMVIFIANLVVALFLLYLYHRYMRFVDFSDVYELRFETNKVQIPSILSYFQMWITYFFIPFFIAVGVERKKMLYCIFAVFLSFLIYLIQGSKLAILMVFMIWLLLYVYDKRGAFLTNLSFYLCLLIFLVFLIPDSSVLNWVKSILFIRILGTPGWLIVHYYEYFTVNGYSYYGHINIINSIFNNYPFGGLSLGQLIGLKYSGSIDANFNANFWASDGIAALGLFGLFIISFVLGLFLKLLDYVSNGFSLRFLFIFTVGFWQALLNIPFATAIFSGGGGLIIVVLLSRNMFSGFSIKKSLTYNSVS